MPANIISINNWAEFYVGDSKMRCLAEVLDKIGFPENIEAKEFLKEAGVEVKPEKVEPEPQEEE